MTPPTHDVTTRRRTLQATSGILAAALAGCTTLLSSDPVRFEAAPAVVDEAVLDDTRYREHRHTTDTITRTYGVAGQEKTVEVTNQIAEYDRGVELAGNQYQAAVFAVLSTPQIDILGRSFNPVGEMTNRDLVDRLQDRYDEIRDVTHRSDARVTILDTDTTVGQYHARGVLAGDSPGLTVDLTLHVTNPVEAGNAFVVCAGGYPSQLNDADTFMTLMAGVTHDA